MSPISLENAQAHLPELIGQLQPGEALVITQDNRPVARLVAEPHPAAIPSKAGAYRKDEFWMALDFDAPLHEFQEYME